MSGPIAPIWFVFPLAGVAMVITAAYLIALREAPASAMPDSRRRLRSAVTWLIMVTLPLTAYGFGVASTQDPKTFMLVWVTVTVLLAFILLFAAFDLMMISAQHRRLTRNHRKAVRATKQEIVRLASGLTVPETDQGSATPTNPDDAEPHSEH